MTMSSVVMCSIEIPPKCDVTPGRQTKKLRSSAAKKDRKPYQKVSHRYTILLTLAELADGFGARRSPTACADAPQRLVLPLPYYGIQRGVGTYISQ